MGKGDGGDGDDGGREGGGLGGWVWLGVAIGLVGAAALVGLVAGLRLVRRRRRRRRAPPILAQSAEDAEDASGGAGASVGRLPSFGCLPRLPAGVRLLPSSTADLAGTASQLQSASPKPEQSQPIVHTKQKKTQRPEKTRPKLLRTKRRPKVQEETPKAQPAAVAGAVKTSFFSLAPSRWRNFVRGGVSAGVGRSGTEESRVGVDAGVGPSAGVSVALSPLGSRSSRPEQEPERAGGGGPAAVLSDSRDSWATTSEAGARSSPTSTATAGSTSSPLSSSWWAFSSLTPVSTSSLPGDSEATLTPDSVRFLLRQPAQPQSLV